MKQVDIFYNILCTAMVRNRQETVFRVQASSEVYCLLGYIQIYTQCQGHIVIYTHNQPESKEMFIIFHRKLKSPHLAYKDFKINSIVFSSKQANKNKKVNTLTQFKNI